MLHHRLVTFIFRFASPRTRQVPGSKIAECFAYFKFCYNA